MAQSKNGPGKRTAGKAGANGSDKAERQAAYFLSLSLENVRCFGPKQTLDLSDGNGKPAPWTIILGLNGTGKTTVLQSIAGFEPLSRMDHLADFRVTRFFDFSLVEPFSFRRGGIATSTFLES